MLTGRINELFSCLRFTIILCLAMMFPCLLSADIVGIILEEKAGDFSLSTDSKVCGSFSSDDAHKIRISEALQSSFGYTYDSHVMLPGFQSVDALKLGLCDIHILSGNIRYYSDVPEEFVTSIRAQGGYFVTVAGTGTVQNTTESGSGCPDTTVTLDLPAITVPLNSGNSFQAPSSVTYTFKTGSGGRCRIDRVVSTRIGNGQAALERYVQSNVPSNSCSQRYSAWGTGIGSEGNGQGIIRYHARVEFWSCITFRRHCCNGQSCRDLGLLGKHCVPRCGMLCTERGETRTGRDTFRHDIRLVPQYDAATDQVSIRTRSSTHGDGAQHWAINAIGAISFGTLSKWYNDTLAAELNRIKDAVPDQLGTGGGSDGVDFQFVRAYFAGNGNDTRLVIEHFLEPDVIGANITLGIINQ